MEKMKAVVCYEYGPPEVLHVTEVARPVPADNEMLIRVKATTANAADCNTRGFTFVPPGLGFLARMMLGIRKPKKTILGSAFSGEVVAAGKDIEMFRIGDRVFGTGPGLGTYAEYMCRTEAGAMSVIPSNVTYEEAATLPYGALTALYFLRDMAGIKKGQKVLVNGASGSIGVFAVQLARYFGAEVTGVCSTPNLDLVKSLGAVRVIDYTKDDAAMKGGTWDIIFDVVVGKTSFSRWKSSLTSRGRYLAVAGGLNDMVHMLLTSVSGGRKVIFGGGTACERKENLEFIKDLLASGELKTVIDKRFTLEQVAEAHRHVESGSKKGNVVISI